VFFAKLFFKETVRPSACVNNSKVSGAARPLACEKNFPKREGNLGRQREDIGWRALNPATRYHFSKVL
jgi:hypothetical protein